MLNIAVLYTSQNTQEKPVYNSYCGFLSYDTCLKCCMHLVGEI